MIGQQMGLPLLRAAQLPFSIRQKSKRRAVLREIRRNPELLRVDVLQSAGGFRLRALLEDQILLDELQRRIRRERRVIKREGKPARAAFACTLGGYKVCRYIDALNARIDQAEDALLCG